MELEILVDWNQDPEMISILILGEVSSTRTERLKLINLFTLRSNGVDNEL